MTRDEYRFLTVIKAAEPPVQISYMVCGNYGVLRPLRTWLMIQKFEDFDGSGCLLRNSCWAADQYL